LEFDQKKNIDSGIAVANLVDQVGFTFAEFLSDEALVYPPQRGKVEFPDEVFRNETLKQFTEKNGVGEEALVTGVVSIGHGASLAEAYVARRTGACALAIEKEQNGT